MTPEENLKKYSIEQLYSGLHELLYNNFGITDYFSEADFNKVMRSVGSIYHSHLPGFSQFGFYHIPTIQISKLKIIRAVPHKVQPELMKDGSYVPDEKKHIIKLGRCNLPNQQIFYGANNYNSALHELYPRIGDRFLISLYEFNRADTVVNYLSSGTGIPGINMYVDIIHEKLKKELSDLEYNKRCHLQKITSLMMLSNNKLLSSYIAHSLFDQLLTKNVAIVYPSILFLNGQINYALTSSAADKCLTPLCYVYAHVEDISKEMHIKISPLASGKPSKDGIRIQWDDEVDFTCPILDKLVNTYSLSK